MKNTDYGIAVDFLTMGQVSAKQKEIQNSFNYQSEPENPFYNYQIGCRLSDGQTFLKNAVDGLVWDHAVNELPF